MNVDIDVMSPCNNYDYIGLPSSLDGQSCLKFLRELKRL